MVWQIISTPMLIAYMYLFRCLLDIMLFDYFKHNFKWSTKVSHVVCRIALFFAWFFIISIWLDV